MATINDQGKYQLIKRKGHERITTQAIEDEKKPDSPFRSKFCHFSKLYHLIAYKSKLMSVTSLLFIDIRPYHSEMPKA